MTYHVRIRKNHLNKQTNPICHGKKVENSAEKTKKKPHGCTGTAKQKQNLNPTVQDLNLGLFQQPQFSPVIFRAVSISWGGGVGKRNENELAPFVLRSWITLPKF